MQKKPQTTKLWRVNSCVNNLSSVSDWLGCKKNRKRLTVKVNHKHKLPAGGGGGGSRDVAFCVSDVRVCHTFMFIPLADLEFFKGGGG